MKRYIAHIKSKSTHHRRQHAAQVAGVFTAVAFVVWITTLPFRFGGAGVVANSQGSDGSDAQQTQLAGVGASDGSDTTGNDGSGIEVVGTTTGDSNSDSPFSNY